MTTLEVLMNEVSISDGRKREAGIKRSIKKLWEIWCEETDRPDSDVVNDEVSECMDYWLKNGYTYRDLAYFVRSAARVKPKKDDQHDVKRLIKVLDEEKAELEATQLYERGKPVYSYKPILLNFKIEQKSDLAEVLNDDEENWDEEDEEAAYWIMTRMTLEKVRSERALMESANVWCDPMIPAEFLAMYRKRAWRKNVQQASTNKRSGTNAYNDGAKEAKITKEIDFFLDPAARKIAQKYSLEQAKQYHNMAPDGYWKAVAEVVDSEDLTLKEAYNELREEYDWHPSCRKK